MTDDPFLKYFLLPLFILVIGALFYVLYIVNDENEKLTFKAHSQGCEYIGRARDLNRVAFFDCNGTIKMERVK